MSGIVPVGLTVKDIETMAALAFDVFKAMPCVKDVESFAVTAESVGSLRVRWRMTERDKHAECEIKFYPELYSIDDSPLFTEMVIESVEREIAFYREGRHQ